MSGRASALFDSDSDGDDDEKLNTAARARNISYDETQTRHPPPPSTSNASSQSDLTRLFTNITPDERDDIHDEGLRARLISLVGELRQGKPARVIDMVLRGLVHDPLRARVFEVAGVRDPQAPEDAPEAEGEHESDEESVNVPVKTTMNRPTPQRQVVPEPVDDDEDEDEDDEVKHVNKQSKSLFDDDEPEEEQEQPVSLPSMPSYNRSSRASSTTSEKPHKKSKKSRRHARASSPAPSSIDRITSTNEIEHRVTSLDVIESDNEVYDEPHALLALVYVLGALSSADLLIIFPSLYAYLDYLGQFSFLIYGFVASGYNAGQILAAPLLGWWSDKRTIKEVLLFCSACLCAGNLMYIFANSNVILLIMGRFVAGLGAANVFIAYAHLAKCSKNVTQRETRHTRYGWLVRITSIIAPGIGSLGSHIHGNQEIVHDAFLNRFTFPAMIMTILFGTVLIVQIIHAIVTRHSIEKQFSQRFHDVDLEAGRLRLGGESFLTRDGIVLLLVYGMILLSYWTFITASFPFLQNEYKWSLEQVYIYYLEIGIIFTISFATLQVALHYSSVTPTSLITHTSLIRIALLFVALGCIMITQFESLIIQIWQIYVCAVLMGAGYTIGTELIPRMFATLTGVEFDSLGLRMSYFFAVASFSASFGPLLGALLIHFSDMPTIGLITLGSCLVAISIVIVVPPTGNFKRVKPITTSNRSGLHESLLASPARVYS